MDANISAAPPTNLCPRCAQAFSCGMRAGVEPCWCAAYPPAFAVPAAAGSGVTEGCYCADCLAGLIAARQAGLG
ncbi:cysteine-rich CWC family protein [Thauera terpenica]|uniref:cysteine-rich CWC family protein n=1 Tax=Thauera terpenica TaxID=76113 RepID=UPI000A02293D|nr:cysteine-rich CWC family protein [Thauera terpenica]